MKSFKQYILEAEEDKNLVYSGDVFLDYNPKVIRDNFIRSMNDNMKFLYQYMSPIFSVGLFQQERFVVPKSISANHFVYKGYFNLLILTLSVNIFVLFKYLSKTKFFINMEEKNFGKALITISKYSFGIYLCHYIVLNRLKVCLLKYFYNQNPLVWIPILHDSNVYTWA